MDEDQPPLSAKNRRGLRSVPVDPPSERVDELPVPAPDSATPDIDAAIALIQKRLNDEKTVTKDWLVLLDRLHKFINLKYKYGAKAKGSKFLRPGGER
jgi:hypothetical protein